jgi:hypothetical protein
MLQCFHITMYTAAFSTLQRPSCFKYIAAALRLELIIIFKIINVSYNPN